MTLVPFYAVTVLVLHGPPPNQKQIEGMYHCMLDCLRLLGVKHPTRVFAPTPGGREIDLFWDKWQRQLQQRGFPDSISGIYMEHDVPIFISVCLANAKFGSDGKGFTLAFDRYIHRFSKETLLLLLRLVTTVYPVQYGYALVRPRSWSPWTYSDRGWLQPAWRADPYPCKDAKREADLKVQWANYANAMWKAGRSPGERHLRDIYPLNFLHKHLIDAIEISGYSLFDYVNPEPKNGSLTQIADTLWLWEIEEQNIKEIRSDFIKAGLLVHYLDKPWELAATQ